MSRNHTEDTAARRQRASSLIKGELGQVDEPSPWKIDPDTTCGIIKRNEDVACSLMHKLERTGRLYGKPLAACLRRVV
jgi:hypothetical protein